MADSNSINHLAVGLAGVDSCYMMQRIPYYNHNWTHPEVAQIEVLLEYLSSRLFETVRGKGLTYGINMHLSMSTGSISLDISPATRLVDAFNEVQSVFDDHLNNATVWESTFLDSSKGSLIYRKTNDEKAAEDLASLG